MRRLSGFALLRVLGVGTVGLAACSAITSNEAVRRERRLGWIRFHQDPVVVEVPDAVMRGADFEVTIRTYGGGCIAQGDTEVTVLASAAEVRPFDIFVTGTPHDSVCTDDLRLYLHRARMRFAQPGVATVRMRGRDAPGGEVIVVERQVTVR